ncbi:MAG: type-F conjugative transfer system pilin assembly protein TrbC [Pseudomonadota bacterium]
MAVAQEADVDADGTRIDRQRIDQAVRDAEEETAAFAMDVVKRAEAYTEDVLALRKNVIRPIKNVDLGEVTDGPIDFHEMLGGAPQIAGAATAEPPPAGVIAFGSFAMPEESLRKLVVDAKAASVPIMLQGFVNGSLGETAKAMQSLLGVESDPANPTDRASLLGGVLVDPRAFRVFGVTHAPTFIATDAPLPDCDGLDCSAPAPAHARIAGNMSLEAALSALAEEGTSGRDEARMALDRLEARHE